MILIVDFDDSFTMNIYSDLSSYNVKIDYKNWRDLTYLDIEKYHGFILGPGPGHPRDYKEIYPIIETIINNDSKFYFGICLGFQIYWSMKGYDIVESCDISHGNSHFLEFPEINYKGHVQRYNSLALKTKLDNACYLKNEVMGVVGDRFLTLQFHPESVGTTNKDTIYSYFMENICL